jgi:hypothetical protein
MQERPVAKGYRYGISAILTGYLLLSSLKTARYENNHWEQVVIEPPPFEKTIPLASLALTLLFPQTTKLARQLGKALTKDEDE